MHMFIKWQDHAYERERERERETEREREGERENTISFKRINMFSLWKTCLNFLVVYGTMENMFY